MWGTEPSTGVNTGKKGLQNSQVTADYLDFKIKSLKVLQFKIVFEVNFFSNF